uniref:Ig-like domain-containing protein n=1 Tax=Sinocyclocheilus anshuiensis TaxID=1608454 RepID=A0A671QCM7_9TELE
NSRSVCFVVVCFIKLLLLSPVSLQVSGFVGDSVLLPCSYQDRELKPEDINVFWRYNESKNVYDIEKGNPSTNKQDAMFKGRIKSVLSRHENGNFSLILSNLMVTDTGQFSCDIPGVKKEFKLTLHVKGDCNFPDCCFGIFSFALYLCTLLELLFTVLLNCVANCAFLQCLVIVVCTLEPNVLYSDCCTKLWPNSVA